MTDDGYNQRPQSDSGQALTNDQLALFDDPSMTCEIPGCDQPKKHGRGRWCYAHYMKMYRYGPNWPRSDLKSDECEVCGDHMPPLTGKGGYRKYCGPGCRSVAYRAHQYGLTIREYMDLFKEHNGCCHICERPLRLKTFGERAQRKDTAHVDHDHATLRVRGLLCGSCNTALGALDDDPYRAEALARYLHKHSAPLDAGTSLITREARCPPGTQANGSNSSAPTGLHDSPNPAPVAPSWSNPGTIGT